MQEFIDNIVTNFASLWQGEGGKKMSFGKMGSLLLSSGKKVFCLRAIAQAAFPCLTPFFASSSEESASPRQEDGQLDGEGLGYLYSGCWWTWWWFWLRRNRESSSIPANQHGEEIAEKQKQVGRVVHITVFTAEIVSTLLASIISYAIFAYTLGSPLAMELSNR